MNIKKIVFAVNAVVFAGFAYSADITWSWWMENKSATEVSFGLANKCSQVKAFDFSVIYSESKVTDGVEWSLFGINNSSDATCELQLSWWFNNGGKPCAQIGCININEESSFGLGLINVSPKTVVQIGFLNFNKNGFLPVFPFVNLDKELFK